MDQTFRYDVPHQDFDVGTGGELMSRMEALMDEYHYRDGTERIHRYSMHDYSHEGQRFDGCGDEEESQEIVGAMGDQSHSFEQFERQLAQGILDAPSLNLHKVPPSIFDNKPPLSIIYLKENNIHELPEYFFDELPGLGWLDLRDNKLIGLPSLNNRHEALKVMLLQGNQIRALPYTLALGVNLKTIGLTGNPMTTPPEEVRQKGCKAMLQYLRKRMLMRVPVDTTGETEIVPMNPEDDEIEELMEDLKRTAAKRVRSTSTLASKPSSTSINSKNLKTDEEKKIERLKYTWELWKKIPYEGPSRVDLFQNSLEEVKAQVLTKLNNQQEAILQKFKNSDVLSNWRRETRMMQARGRPRTDFCPVANAPFGNKFNQVQQKTSKPLNPEEFQNELVDCWDKLKLFASSPAPISDTEAALTRLREVEHVQQRLMDIKLSVKPGPTPI